MQYYGHFIEHFTVDDDFTVRIEYTKSQKGTWDVRALVERVGMGGGITVFTSQFCDVGNAERFGWMLRETRSMVGTTLTALGEMMTKHGGMHE